MDATVDGHTYVPTPHTHVQQTPQQTQESLRGNAGDGASGGGLPGVHPRVGEAVRQIAQEHVLPGVVALLNQVCVCVCMYVGGGVSQHQPTNLTRVAPTTHTDNNNNNHTARRPAGGQRRGARLARARLGLPRGHPTK